jgi:hypothetical protein
LARDLGASYTEGTVQLAQALTRGKFLSSFSK